MSAVRVSVPASTANLGPGFDSLGLALELRNEIEMSEHPFEWLAHAEGEGADVLAGDAGNLVLRSARALLDEAGRSTTGLSVRCLNRIPLAAGLGSSSAAIVGGLAAANRLFGLGRETGALLSLAARIEGHADNVAPALCGGLMLVSREDDRPLVRRVALPPLRVVVATPEFGLPTAETRAALPQQVPLKDAVFNIGRSLLVVEALRAGDWELLGRALEDRLHQPQRSERIPGYHDVAGAAREAGAAAVALSGGGPSLAAFCADSHDAVSAAMVSAWRSHGVGARAFVLDSTERGVAFG